MAFMFAGQGGLWCSFWNTQSNHGVNLPLTSFVIILRKFVNWHQPEFCWAMQHEEGSELTSGPAPPPGHLGGRKIQICASSAMQNELCEAYQDNSAVSDVSMEGKYADFFNSKIESRVQLLYLLFSTSRYQLRLLIGARTCKPYAASEIHCSARP